MKTSFKQALNALAWLLFLCAPCGLFNSAFAQGPFTNSLYGYVTGPTNTITNVPVKLNLTAPQNVYPWFLYQQSFTLYPATNGFFSVSNIGPGPYTLTIGPAVNRVPIVMPTNGNHNFLDVMAPGFSISTITPSTYFLPTTNPTAVGTLTAGYFAGNGARVTNTPSPFALNTNNALPFIYNNASLWGDSSITTVSVYGGGTVVSPNTYPYQLFGSMPGVTISNYGEGGTTILDQAGPIYNNAFVYPGALGSNQIHIYAAGGNDLDYGAGLGAYTYPATTLVQLAELGALSFQFADQHPIGEDLGSNTMAGGYGQYNGPWFASGEGGSSVNSLFRWWKEVFSTNTGDSITVTNCRGSNVIFFFDAGVSNVLGSSFAIFCDGVSNATVTCTAPTNWYSANYSPLTNVLVATILSNLPPSGAYTLTFSNIGGGNGVGWAAVLCPSMRTAPIPIYVMGIFNRAPTFFGGYPYYNPDAVAQFNLCAQSNVNALSKLCLLPVQYVPIDQALNLFTTNDSTDGGHLTYQGGAKAAAVLGNAIAPGVYQPSMMANGLLAIQGTNTNTLYFNLASNIYRGNITSSSNVSAASFAGNAGGLTNQQMVKLAGFYLGNFGINNNSSPVYIPIDGFNGYTGEAPALEVVPALTYTEIIFTYNYPTLGAGTNITAVFRTNEMTAATATVTGPYTGNSYPALSTNTTVLLTVSNGTSVDWIVTNNSSGTIDMYFSLQLYGHN